MRHQLGGMSVLLIVFDVVDDTVKFAERTEVLAVARAAWIASFLDQDQGPGVR